MDLMEFPLGQLAQGQSSLSHLCGHKQGPRNQQSLRAPQGRSSGVWGEDVLGEKMSSGNAEPCLQAPKPGLSLFVLVLRPSVIHALYKTHSVRLVQGLGLGWAVCRAGRGCAVHCPPKPDSHAQAHRTLRWSCCGCWSGMYRV